MHKNRKTTEQFALEILNKYNLKLLTEYLGAKIKCTVQAPCEHTWNIIPNNLLSKGHGKICRECSGLAKTYISWDSDNLHKLSEAISENRSIEEIAKLFNTTIHAINKAVEIHNFNRKDYKLKISTIPKILDIIKDNKYTLTTTIDEISNSREDITYICDKKHIYTQLIGNFLKGHKCGECAKDSKESKGEKGVLEYIKSILPKNTWIIENDRSILNGKELDIVLPDLGIAIEYNGDYWHSEEKVGTKKHINKLIEVNNFNYRLITITDEEWLYKTNIVKSRLKNILGFGERIYARNCIIKSITYKETSNFCNNNHIQGGNANTSINLGLFNSNILVAIMSFSKARFTTECEYELVRYCSLLNTSIVGGASKLLKYFENNYTPKSLISYSDRRWNTGNLYIKLGFKFSHNSAPNYKYVKNGKSYSRQQFMKHKLQSLFPDIYLDNKTEKQIMIEAGYYRVYDCGSTTFIKKYE